MRGALGLGKTYPIGTNVPILGDFKADIPVEQMTKDATAVALTTLEQKLPLFLDRNMPVMYAKALPYISAQKASLVGDVEYLVPEVLQEVLDDVVLPELEIQKARILAELDKRLFQVLAGTVAVTAAGAVAAYYLRRRR